MAGGRLLKGTLTAFSPTAPTVRLRLAEGPDLMEVSIKEVKAIFYVKTYAGDKQYREKRKFGLAKVEGKRVMVRFKDGEILCGYTDKGLSGKARDLRFPSDPKQVGFFLYPADPRSNNTKVFVTTSFMLDIHRL